MTPLLHAHATPGFLVIFSAIAIAVPISPSDLGACPRASFQVKVRNLAIQPGEETLVCTLENNQMFMLSLSNSELMKPEEMNFEVFTQSFHSQGITGMDCCIRKPLIATCSTDMSVRIWNYQDKNIEQVRLQRDRKKPRLCL